MFELITDEIKKAALEALNLALSTGIDKPATVELILEVVKEDIAKHARFNVFKGLKTCPSCLGATASPGLVREYFLCTSEWHIVKAIVDVVMTPIAVSD